MTENNTLPPSASPQPTTTPATPGRAPAHVAHPQTVRSFVRRTGRVTTGQAKAFAELGSTFVLPFQTAPLDMVAAFGRSAPVILEIGFGMGEATAHMATELLKARGLQVTRLARGVPVGSELEYVDLGTIAHALVERR